MTGPPDEGDAGRAATAERFPPIADAEVAVPAGGPKATPRGTWKIIAGVLAVLVIVLGAVAIVSRGNEAEAVAELTANQQAALEKVAKADAQLDAKSAQIAALEKESAALSATAEQLAGGQRGAEVRPRRRDGHRERRRDGRRRCAGRVEPAPRHRRRGEPAGGRAGRAGGDPEQGDRHPHHGGQPPQ